MAKRIEWTPRRLANLKALIEEGLTYREIGRRMRTSRDSVAGAAKSYGLSQPGKHPARKPWSRQELDYLELMFNQGVPYPVIAKRLGRTYCSIRTVARRIGITGWDVFSERQRRHLPGAMKIIVDCIELERMTVPMIVERLAAHGYYVSRHWVLSRIHEQGQGLVKEMRANAANRRARALQRVALRRTLGKQQKEAA